MTLAVLTAATTTAGSRWYVTSAFTTFFVVLMLVRVNPGVGVGVLNERVGETVLGVGLAYLFGLAIPTLVRHRPAGDGRNG